MIDINLIKGLKNKDCLEDTIEKNKDDYGYAIVSVAVNVMIHLDEFDGDFNIGYHPDMSTPHGIICNCDDQGGITGFMAGAVRNIVAKCHELGWRFYLAYLLNEYNIHKKDNIDNFIKNLVDENLVSYDEAKNYVDGLIKRHKERSKAD